jgi:hypothetical protein
MCRSNGVGMFANEVGARSETIAVAEAEPPTGGVPNAAGARKQSCYAKFGMLLSNNFLFYNLSYFLLNIFYIIVM